MKKIACISARTGIKSSMEKHISLVILSFILWLKNNRPAYLEYGEEKELNGTTMLSPSDSEIGAVLEFLAVQKADLDIAQNPIYKSQLEPLQVCALNCYKFGSFHFTKMRSDSAERAGGSRYRKTITFTSLFDAFAAVSMLDETHFKRFSLAALKDEDVSVQPFFSSYYAFWLPFINLTRFKDSNDHELNLMTELILRGYEFHHNGPARILKRIRKEVPSLNYGNGTTLRDDVERFHFRSENLRSVFVPNYCNDGGSELQESGVSEQETFFEEVRDSNPKEMPDIPKNLLFTGVPGTGKSYTVDSIIRQYFLDDKQLTDGARVLRINIHSATKNADLMQGVGVALRDSAINYTEKRGLVLQHILRAIQSPETPFALILEEVQENDLNQLLGDLIFLIEPTRRARLKANDMPAEKFDDEFDLINYLIKNQSLFSVDLPPLVEDLQGQPRRLILPENLYLLCTSNFREGRKTIQDNMLRRFTVIELFPKGELVKNEQVRVFLETLNQLVLREKAFFDPESNLIGHAEWMNVDNRESFFRAFYRLVVNFKDIKKVDFETAKRILSELAIPFESSFNVREMSSYRELLETTRERCAFGFLP